MIDKDEAIAKFKEILIAKSAWKILARSQFVTHLAIFVGWCLRSALFAVERTLQEFFLSTALNDSSIMAHAEDREYIPRKRTSATGSGTITNNGSATVWLPENQPFVSDAQLDYVTDRALTIGPAETVEVEFSQLKKAEFIHTVAEEKAFYEILLDDDFPGMVHDFTVYVDLAGDGYEEWTIARLLQNTFPGDYVYDEFFSHGARAGIRFGNEYAGKILPVGALVKVSLRVTEGETYLAEGQQLSVVGEILDSIGQPADMTAITTEAVVGGSAAETTEEMRTNLRYWPIYNKKLIWEDDYAYFVRRNVAGIIWVKIWGEEAAEAAYGPKFEFVNKIFVSAYATDRPDLETEVMDQFADVHIFNRKFKWVDPLFSAFSLLVTGKVPRSAVISDVISAISETLKTSYGKDSTTRVSEVHVKDFYRLINETGYFSGAGAYFEVGISGKTVPTELHEMVYVDLETTTFDLNYV